MKYKLFFYLTIIVITQISCRSTKEIRMFQDSQEDYASYYEPSKQQDHLIEPNDNLYISVLTLDPEVNQLFNPSRGGSGLNSGTQQMYGSPESRLINGYKVSPDSTIQLPILGKIKIVGITLEKAQEILKQRAEEYLKEPTVQVKLLNFRVNLSGEVRNPGIYYNYEGQLNIYEAISMASGITDFADLHNVIVKRESHDKVLTYNLDLTNNSVYTSEVFHLQTNDLIYIPPSTLKRRTQNSDTYSRILSTISTLLVAAALFLSL